MTGPGPCGIDQLGGAPIRWRSWFTKFTSRPIKVYEFMNVYDRYIELVLGCFRGNEMGNILRES